DLASDPHLQPCTNGCRNPPAYWGLSLPLEGGGRWEMGEHEESRGISRRQLLTRLGAGTAVAWLTPIATSLGSRADALCVCEGDACDWVCGGTLQQCGTCGPLGAAYCSHDTDGNCSRWENCF